MSHTYSPIAHLTEARDAALRSLERCAAVAHEAVLAETAAIDGYDGSRAAQARLAAAMTERHAACVAEQQAQREVERLRRWDHILTEVTSPQHRGRRFDAYGIGND